MPLKHRETFYASASWTRLQERLKEMAARHGSDLLMASDWIMDDLKFEDATHLNEEGARDFSIRLAGAISSLEPGIAQVASRAAAP
jgi:hypothetical protein